MKNRVTITVEKKDLSLFNDIKSDKKRRFKLNKLSNCDITGQKNVSISFNVDDFQDAFWLGRIIEACRYTEFLLKRLK